LCGPRTLRRDGPESFLEEAQSEYAVRKQHRNPIENRITSSAALARDDIADAFEPLMADWTDDKSKIRGRQGFGAHIAILPAEDPESAIPWNRYE
jgi:hypothetical protein